MIAGTLEIQLLANMARLQADIDKGVGIVGGFGAKVESIAASAQSALGAIGIGLGVGALASYAAGLINAAAEMEHLSERTGIAVGRLSELTYAAKLANVDVGQFGTAMSFFEKTMVAGTNSTSKAGQIFAALGVDITQGPNVALTQFAERASAIDDVAVKTSVFREVFGKAGADLIEWAKNLKETTDQAKALGITMSEETAASAKLLEDNLKALKAQSAALSLQWMSNDIGALAAMAINIEKAAESGNKWLQILKELAKLLSATGGVMKDMPGIIGQYGTAMDKLATQLFKDPNAMRPGEVGGKIGGLTGAAATSAPSSTDLAAILSGAKDEKTPGMSEHDLQVYANAVQAVKELEAAEKDRAKAADEADASFVRAMKEFDTYTENQNKALEQQAQNWKDLVDPMEPYRRQLVEINNLYSLNKLSSEEWSKSIDIVTKSMGESGKVADQAADIWKTAAKDMQRSMETFFFDALQGKMTSFGASFKTMIDHMLSNWMAAQAQMALFGDFGKTNVMGGLVGKGLSALGIGAPSNFAYGSTTFAEAAAAGAIPMAGGGDYMVSKPTLFLAGEAGPERATFSGANNASGGGVSITQHLSFGSDVNRSTLIQWAEVIKQNTVAAVRESQARAPGQWGR